MKRMIFACLVAMIIPQAGAELPSGPATKAEIAALPPLCRVKLGGSSQAEMSAAERSLGANNWLHFHHYCFAVKLPAESPEFCSIAIRSEMDVW